MFSVYVAKENFFLKRNFSCVRHLFQRSFAYDHNEKKNRRKEYRLREKKDKNFRKKVLHDFNPFYKNFGMGSILKSTDIDADKIDQYDVEDFEDLNEEFLSNFQSREEVKQFSRMPRDEYLKMKARNKKKIILRKYFPKQKNPNLLTWAEKYQIRYLYNSDPKNWSVKALSENFFATPGIISLIVRNRVYMKPEKIKYHDAVVAENWKLLSRGELEIPSELEERLSNFEISKSLPVQALLQIEESFLEEENKKIALEEQKPLGKFSKILKNYETKLQNEGNKEFVPNSDTSVIYRNPTNDTSEWFRNLKQLGPDPYNDTRYIGNEYELSKERHMTIDKYKKKYLMKLINNKRDAVADNKRQNMYATEYSKWLTEHFKKRALHNNTVKLFDPNKDM